MGIFFKSRAERVKVFSKGTSVADIIKRNRTLRKKSKLHAKKSQVTYRDY